jgi:hypothetical protein
MDATGSHASPKNVNNKKSMEERFIIFLQFESGSIYLTGEVNCHTLFGQTVSDTVHGLHILRQGGAVSLAQMFSSVR